MAPTRPRSWLLLIHQIPPTPAYLRVKVWRRLQALGAVAIKNAVYVLPNGNEAREDFAWVTREIVKDGGDATICEARLLEGLGDHDLQRSFAAARSADYAHVTEAARTLAAALPRGAVPERRRARSAAGVARLRQRLGEIARIDFFGAPGREAAEGRVSALEARLRAADGEHENGAARVRIADLRGRVWVTRQGIHVDRIASAWLIRRFVDRKARFKFVAAKGYEPAPKEIRFDMFEAEFTHEGESCTFEVLIARLGLRDRALAAIAEIVHDIDLKDAKFDRAETAGVARVVAGIAMADLDDDARLARGSAVLDGLYEYFGKGQP